MAIGPVHNSPLAAAPQAADAAPATALPATDRQPASKSDAPPFQTIQPGQNPRAPARTTGDTSPVAATSQSVVMAAAQTPDILNPLDLSAIIEPKTDPAFLTEEVAREMALKLQRSIEESMILTQIITKSAASPGQNDEIPAPDRAPWQHTPTE